MRRRSQQLHGVPPALAQELAAIDEEFYGSDGSSDSDDSDQPMAKRARGAREREDEYFSDSGEDSGEQSGSGSSEGDAADDDGYQQVCGKLQNLVEAGCGCGKTNHFAIIEEPKAQKFMFDFLQLGKAQRKSYALASLSACYRTSATERHHGAAEAAGEEGPVTRKSYSYGILGHTVCRTTYMEMLGLSKHTLESLQKQVKEGNVVPTEHKLKGVPRPDRAYPKESVDCAVNFISGVASTYGLPQPAAARGRANTAPTFLPASKHKKAVHDEYVQAMQAAANAGIVPYHQFTRLWSKHLSHIVVSKPRSDVCHICDLLRMKARKPKTEEETRTAGDALSAHLDLATAERNYYNKCIADSTFSIPLSPQSVPQHFTFDFAQQLELPYHTRQVGPIYFKVRYRVQLFGVCEESAHCQHNYLFHESQCIGKDGKNSHGPNAVLSMLHTHLCTHAISRKLVFHADNCVGQNKNRTVVGYMLWRCMCGLSEDIELNFMRVGHTRCAVDGYFGALKKKFRSMDIDSLNDVETMVNCSCAANHAVMFGWEWRSWAAYLDTMFKPIRGIATYQHFRFSKASPGTVFVRAEPASEETPLQLLKQGAVVSANLPPTLPPAGLTAARRVYVETSLQQHFTEGSALPWRTADDMVVDPDPAAVPAEPVE